MKNNMKWWSEARFGLFAHWGLYSKLGGVWQNQRMDYIGEWIQSRFQIPNSEMEKIAESFNPVNFDADEWAMMAKQAGMGYIMVTAKHHEGFAMYRSKCDKYNIFDATPFKRDPIKELSEACARHGIKLCLYYSQSLDWHEPDAGGAEPDLPLNFGMSWGNNWDFPDYESKKFDRYFENKVIPQITELLTGYGPIGAIFFDCPFTISCEQCKRIDDLVKSLQPECLTNSRLGHGFGDIMTLGDNQIPGCRMNDGCECISTINDTWGYKIYDENWKSRDQLLELLTACCANNVNYLLNIGPKADGRFPEPAVKILEQLGKWMQVNRESVYKSQASPFPSDLPSGPVTLNDDKIYLHMQKKFVSPLRIYGIKNSVKSAECLGKDIDLTYESEITAPLNIPCVTLRFSEKKLNKFDVIKISLDGMADVIKPPVQTADGTIVLSAGSAEILASDKIKKRKEEIRLGAAGERFGGVSPSLSLSGVITGWFDTGYSLKWRFLLNNPGRYKVYVTTGTIYHSKPWAGGHKVRIRTDESVSGDEILRGKIPSASVEDLYYPKAASYAGEITFYSAGEHWAVLEGTEIFENDGAGLSVCSMTFEPYIEK